MSKKNKEKKDQPVTEETASEVEEIKEEAPVEEAPAEEAPKAEVPQESELEKAQKAQAAEHDLYLRLAAEYDNFRKRSRKEKEALYTDVKAETVAKFLPS